MTPEIAALIGTADVAGPGVGKARATMLAAMREAAERRIAGVTEKGQATFLGRPVTCTRGLCSYNPDTRGTSKRVAGPRGNHAR